jgi:hypothetical protein
MIVVFVEQVSERLIYTLDFLFKERDLNYQITNDLVLFKKSNALKFNYSNLKIDNVFHLNPSTLLFDEEVKDYEVDLSIYLNEPCLSLNGYVDPLASIFFVLSRMEEYLIDREDIHGRFTAKFSYQLKFKLLDKAVCDRWSIKFLESFYSYYDREFKSQKSRLSIVPTFDIDNVYAYKWKKGLRKWLSVLRDLLSRNSYRLNQRKQVLAGIEKDPYDTYDEILKIRNKGFKVYMFWLLGDYARYDKNISYSDVRHQDLIKSMGDQVRVGLHPSYKSNSFITTVTEEKRRIENILETEVRLSRQHFLRFKIQKTYPMLIKVGFEHDFSMGFSDHYGFRSGTARPHFWFDLSKNRITNLMIHPFVYMDGTLNEYMKLSIEEAKEVVDELSVEIQQFGGEFISIWHNETIGGYGKWKGWKDVLDYTLQKNEDE